MITFEYTGAHLIAAAESQIVLLEDRKCQREVEIAKCSWGLMSIDKRLNVLHLIVKIQELRAYINQFKRYNLDNTYNVSMDELRLFGLT